MGQVLHRCAITTHAVLLRYSDRSSAQTSGAVWAAPQDSCQRVNGPSSTMPRGAERRTRQCCRQERSRRSASTRCRWTTASSLAGDVPHLTRSSLHRCLRHASLSAGDRRCRSPLQRYPIGHFHLTCRGSHWEGSLPLVAMIASSSSSLMHRPPVSQRSASAAPIQPALHHPHCTTDNGIQFGDMPSRRTGPTPATGCTVDPRREHGIEHRLTKPHP